jgi:hypothetical protein
MEWKQCTIRSATPQSHGRALICDINADELMPQVSEQALARRRYDSEGSA